MKIRIGLLGLATCLALSGCDTYTAAPYAISMDNVMLLKRSAPANVTVGAFAGPANPSMLCRLVGPIHLPGDIAPQDYLAQALTDELEAAGLTGGSTTPLTLIGSLTQFDYNSMIGSGTWNLAETVSSSNGRSVSVSNQYSFHSSFVGDAACHDVADAFEPAVQALNEKLIADPGFAALLKN